MRGIRMPRSLLVVALLLTGLTGAAPTAHAPRAPTDGFGPHSHPAGAADPGQAASARVCSRSPGPDRVSCQAVIRTDLPPIPAFPPHAAPPGYGPRDIRSAYGLSGHSGHGRTVAITVAFHDPNLEDDLAVYRRGFHLPPCTKANGCLRQIDQRGSTDFPPGSGIWALEESLDADAVSAACPDCRILVVEADDDHARNQFAAVDQAVVQGAKFVSNSWGSPESATESLFDHRFRDHPGIVFTFAAGDAGYGAQLYPAASPWVTAVGGTTLRRAANLRGWGERSWSGAGSGCSLYEPKPFFQHDPLCGNRTLNDASADADPATGLAVYLTYGTSGRGWLVVGGTSLASPLLGAMYALAGVPGPGDYPNSYPYQRPLAFHDIRMGSNGACGRTYLCTAVTGYDGPTGIGTPRGVLGLRRPLPFTRRHRRHRGWPVPPSARRARAESGRRGLVRALETPCPSSCPADEGPTRLTVRHTRHRG